MPLNQNEMAGNPWLIHLKKVYAANKSKGVSYSQAMKLAKASYKKTDKVAAPKKKDVGASRGQSTTECLTRRCRGVQR